MSVIIKGMEMPKSCVFCPIFDDVYTHFSDDDEYVCELGVNLNYYQYAGDEPKNCPLIELPPHGRLIDADALMETFRERKRPTLSDGEDGSKERVRYLDFISTLQAIKDAPTIIPAEEGET